MFLSVSPSYFDGTRMTHVTVPVVERLRRESLLSLLCIIESSRIDLVYLGSPGVCERVLITHLSASSIENSATFANVAGNLKLLQFKMPLYIPQVESRHASSNDHRCIAKNGFVDIICICIFKYTHA